MFIRRRYRDKERDPAPITTTPRATTPSESKKPSINVTVNPKSLATTTQPKATAKVSKKIDMGAASNFGRDELGINSPTHRNTHAEEDLFATSNVPAASTAQTDLLDDLFKTCSAPSNSSQTTAVPQSNTSEDDFFNPRTDDTQEFGDFASAFAAVPEPPSSLIESNDEKKSDFADFGSAFETQQTSSNTTDPANLLFSINSTQNAQSTASNSNQKVGDLLSDLDGLSLDVAAPTGKCFHHALFRPVSFAMRACIIRCLHLCQL